ARTRALPAALAGAAGLDNHVSAALGAAPRRPRRAIGFEDVADDDPRTLLREEPRLDGAHPPRATADESNLAREPHRCLPPRSGGRHSRLPPRPDRSAVDYTPAAIISSPFADNLTKASWTPRMFEEARPREQDRG